MHLTKQIDNLCTEYSKEIVKMPTINGLGLPGPPFISVAPPVSFKEEYSLGVKGVLPPVGILYIELLSAVPGRGVWAVPGRGVCTVPGSGVWAVPGNGVCNGVCKRRIYMSQFMNPRDACF